MIRQFENRNFTFIVEISFCQGKSKFFIVTEYIF